MLVLVVMASVAGVVMPVLDVVDVIFVGDSWTTYPAKAAAGT